MPQAGVASVHPVTLRPEVAVELLTANTVATGAALWALLRLFTSSLGSRNIHLTIPLVPLIALLIDHQNHSKWHKWCHVRFNGDIAAASAVVGTAKLFPAPSLDPLLDRSHAAPFHDDGHGHRHTAPSQSVIR